MSKKTFLDKLERETDKSVANYYEELISDRVEAGEDEQKVIASYDIRRIAAESRYKESKAELEKLSKDNRRWKTWVVILALFSAPVTIPLGFAFLVVIFSLSISMIAIVASMVFAPLWSIAGGIQLMIAGYAWAGIGMISVSLLLFGMFGLIAIYMLRLIKIFVGWLSTKFFARRKRNTEQEVTV